MADIHVLGSLNADLVTRIDAFPSAGETRRAESFAIHAGGKGANQAVAAGKLGADVAMFGALGDDALASHLRTSLDDAGVDATHVAVRDGVSTGTASIWVDADGENAIAIAAGANGTVDAAYVGERRDALASCRYLLLQGEIPIETMAALLDQLGSEGPRVVLDPAPVFDLNALPRGALWLATPNEHELSELTDMPTGTEDEIRAACAALRDAHEIGSVICKAGGRGSFLAAADGFHHAPAYEVDAVDTTAAGDAFNGGLAAAMVDGTPLEDALRFANAVAALAVTREGAQPAMPTRAAVETFLEERS